MTKTWIEAVPFGYLWLHHFEITKFSFYFGAEFF